MKTKHQSDPFSRPRTPVDLVAAQVPRLRVGVSIRPQWQHAYAECFARLTLDFAAERDAYVSDPAAERGSSPLFWEPGIPAQVLLWAEAAGLLWNLSLTRWGVLRWECRRSGDARPLAFLESATPLPTLLPVTQPGCVGVTLARGKDGQVQVRLLAGAAGGRLAQLAEGAWKLPAGCEQPVTLLVGQGPRGQLKAAARPRSLLVAQTVLHAVYQGRWQGRNGIDTRAGQASGLACRLDADTVLAYPGVDYNTTTGNYWHHLTITDPQVRRVRFPIHCGMSTRFFASSDGRDWTALPGTAVPGENQGLHALEVELPRRHGELRLANTPVYDEAQRDRDLIEATRLGAVVHQVATSRGGLPVHAVELGRGKTGVVLVCGQHSPIEQMTGFYGLPLLQELTRLHSGRGPGRGILDRLTVFWVPLCNIDCARRAWAGYTLDGTNPNRHWFTGRGPEQRGIQEFFRRRVRLGLRMGLMIDGHAGGIWRNHTLLSMDTVAHDRLERAVRAGRPLALSPVDGLKRRWFPLFDRYAGLHELWQNGLSGPGLAGAPHWFQHAFGCPAITIECSVSSQRNPLTRRIEPVTQKEFSGLGRHLAETLVAGIDLLEERR